MNTTDDKLPALTAEEYTMVKDLFTRDVFELELSGEGARIEIAKGPRAPGEHSR